MNGANHEPVDFFLGTTTPAGFKGYFQSLRREPGMQMVLLKSGPGCGKSTLMKQLAQQAQRRYDGRIGRAHAQMRRDGRRG